MIWPKTRCTHLLIAPNGDPAGRQEIYFETQIDMDQLFLLARNAAENKSGTAKDGPLRIRILERRPL
jgi:hypothetical protein